MVARQAKQVYSVQPTEKDLVLLQNCLKWVNRERFDGKLTINARWEYPSAVEEADPWEAIKSLPHSKQMMVAEAVQAYSERNWQKARELLHPFLTYELKLVTNLYTSTLRHLKEPVWFNQSQQLWRNESDRAAPAVASLEVKDSREEILVSPALSSVGFQAPRYVICYVIYHEALHKVLGTNPNNPHPPLFRRLEASIHRRNCAVEWLRKHRFSTIEDF